MASLGKFLKQQAGGLVDGAINGLLGGIFGGGDSGPGFNVENMITSLNTQGVAKTSHFEVYINAGRASDGKREREMAFRIEAVDLPGRNLLFTDHKFGNIGPINKIPNGGQTYSDVTMSIICSEDLREKEYFEWWHEQMVNTGAYEGTPYTALDGTVSAARTEQERMLAEQEAEFFDSPTSSVLSPWYVKYFTNYVGSVEIRQYGLGGDLRSVHTLREAYPIFISPISMTWGSEDVVRLQVTFAYRNYKVVFNRQDQPSMLAGFSFKLGKDGFSGNLNIPGIGSLGYSPGAGFGGQATGLAGKSKSIFKNILK